MPKFKIAYKWEMIMLLWFAFFLNQGDRQIFNVVIPLIREDLHLTDVQLGLVATVFTLFYGLLVPFAGYAGDAIKKSRVVMLSLLIFSVGTLFTGFSTGLIMLIIFRSIATGAGEAFYYPAANTLIGDYHKNTRAQAMSIHQTANYIGVVVSGFIAGYIGEKWGWKMAFITFGIIGVVWAILIGYRLKDAKPVKQVVERIPIKMVVQSIIKTPTLYMLSIAFGGMVFVQIGFLTWMSTFLHEKYSLSLSNAGFSSMFYHHLLAFAGVLLGGRISDKLALKRKQVRMEFEIIGLLLGAPFIFLMGYTNSLLITYVALAGFGFFRGIYDSNLFAAMFDVIDPKYRASATGLMLAFAFIIGALAPVVLGWVKQTFGLGIGISSLGFVYLISALVVFASLKLFFRKDYIGD